MPDNGIVDCISRLASKTPVSVLRNEIDEEEREMQIQRRNANLASFVHGYQGVSALEEQKRQEQEAHAAAMAKIGTYGLTDILGGLDG